MKRLLIILFVFCTIFVVAQKTQNLYLVDVLKKVETQTFVTDFAISITEKATEPVTYTGFLQMRGNKFIIEMNGVRVAYDGKTLFWLDTTIQELTLSHPTTFELIEANPFMYAMQVRDKFSEKTTTENQITTIVLTPKSKDSEIKRYTMQVNSKNKLPMSIVLDDWNNKKTTIKFHKQSYSNDIPIFKIEANDVNINDLR